MLVIAHAVGQHVVGAAAVAVGDQVPQRLGAGGRGQRCREDEEDEKDDRLEDEEIESFSGQERLLSKSIGVY